VALRISAKVRRKLASKNPPIAVEEVEQCFANRTGKYLEDIREQHQSDPPTQWFISETDFGRDLKVVFVPRGADIYLRTAYDPNLAEWRIYKKHGSND